MFVKVWQQNKVYIGIDNGVSGAVGIIHGSYYSLVPMPTKSEQSYTKAKQLITRVDFDELGSLLKDYEHNDVLAILERPMVNPGRFKATNSALRCLEAVLICVELFGFPRMYVDSKEWQKMLLPAGLQKDELKKASADIGKRLFPKIQLSSKLKDADALLIAEWARRKAL